MSAQFVASAPGAMIDRPHRRKLWLTSLTSKLVAGVVALVIVLVALIGGLTWYALRAFLDNRLDQQLSPIALANEQHIDFCITHGVSDCQIGPDANGYRAPQTEWLAVLHPNGTVAVPVTASAALQPMNLSAEQGSALAADPDGIRSLTTTDGQSLRVSTHSLTVSGTRYVVVSGLSTADVERTLHRLINVELIIGASAVVLAFGATFWGVQRSLRNLYRVTGTAREVTAELSATGAGLDRRVPVVEEGTEVGQLAESMNTLLSAVELQFAARVESEDRMRQFLADASHELRTPLTSIRGYAELARMQKAAGADAEDNLDRIESEGTRMSRLVEDLLMLARNDDAANARSLQREPVELASVLDDVASSTRAAFPDRTVELDLAPVPVVFGDRDQLLRVVRNLATNACVHTRPEAPVLLRCAVDGDGVVVQVIDGGPGLPPEDAAHVFERFWRADKARTRARGGSGLGLSIVATVVRAHSGTVHFESSVETGSTATVWLPSTPPADTDIRWTHPDAAVDDHLDDHLDDRLDDHLDDRPGGDTAG